VLARDPSVPQGYGVANDRLAPRIRLDVDVRASRCKGIEMTEVEPPDEYYKALGRIVAMSARLELMVLELALAIELGSAPRHALIDYLPDYSRPGAILSYANRVAPTLSDRALRANVQSYLERVADLLLERHVATHGIISSAIGFDPGEEGGGGERQFWVIFDAKTKAMREMSLKQMGTLADSLVGAEPEGRNLRDIIAPPPDRTALGLLTQELLRRRAAGEDTAEVEAQLLNDAARPSAPRHNWQFRGPTGQQQNPIAG